MIESSKGQQEEFEDDEEVGTHKGKRSVKNRTKHSETEQRRRSKINQRFQILRDLIPQNDQKRDKASFLLEVIEYIGFLQEKLNMYEGSYLGWSSEPKKLIPWKHDHVPTEEFSGRCQAIENSPDLQNNVDISPSMLRDPQNSVESDTGSAMVYKTHDHLSGSATQSVHVNVPRSNMFDRCGSRGTLQQSLRESVSEVVSVDLLPQTDQESWEGGRTTACALNSALTSQEEKTRSVSITNSYSQGILDTLTQALQSSGADMSRTSVAVQIDVASQADSVLTSMASGSKNIVNRSLNERVVANSRVTDTSNKYEQAHKRLRVEQ